MLQTEVITVERIDVKSLQGKLNTFLGTLDEKDIVDISYITFEARLLATVLYRKEG